MKIVFIEWKSFGKQDIINALTDLGHTVVTFSHPDYDLRVSRDFTEKFMLCIGKEHPDAVFSSNYFPLVSTVCNKYNIPYISWVYDCPHLSLYSATVINKCNHIFLFDSSIRSELFNAGITTVHYMPLAAPTARLDSMTPDCNIHKKLDCDISFVGSLYDEKHNLFDRLSGISEFAKGYLEAIMASQLQISGYSFIENLLNEDVLSELRKAAPYTPNPDGVESDKYIYSSFFIERKLTEIERKKLLKSVSGHFNLNLYTHNPPDSLPDAHFIGPIDYETTMPYVFKCSKINLNITLRSIHSGIPLRAMDIMGAGGFLLSNYQEDFLRHFEPGTDFVYFDGKNDLLSKCEYFLSHEKERKEIAANGYKKVKAYHSYGIRLKEIFDIVFNSQVPAR